MDFEGRIALIDTIPISARNQGSVNLGYEIAADVLGADRYLWRDRLNGHYDTIAFNIFYPTHILNIVPFLVNNGIGSTQRSRAGVQVVAGGQGVSNLYGCLGDIVNDVFEGEIDGDSYDLKGWSRATEITSRPVIKNGKAVIELTRGCMYKCRFCEYSWVHGGRYREKDIALVEQQITELTEQRIFKINFLSANLGGYKALPQLMEVCKKQGVKILNTDVCFRDIQNMEQLIVKNQAVKLGIESFNESTRKNIGKHIADHELHERLSWLAQHAGNIHLYLIYGLPHDDYSRWIWWLEEISRIRREQTKLVSTLFGPIRKNTHNVRFEFNITNFEPCRGTPLEKAPEVNFVEKDRFLIEWAKALRGFGFRKGEREVTYGTDGGRFGRMENSYKLLMALKKYGRVTTDALVHCMPYGVGRTIKDDKAANFLDICKAGGARERKFKEGFLLARKNSREYQRSLF